MTHNEAIQLQIEIDNYLTEVLEETEIDVSLTLVGKFKVRNRMEGWSISLNVEDYSIYFINYSGGYKHFLSIIDRLIPALIREHTKVQRLIWSYLHIGELEGE